MTLRAVRSINKLRRSRATYWAKQVRVGDCRSTYTQSHTHSNSALKSSSLLPAPLVSFLWSAACWGCWQSCSRRTSCCCCCHWLCWRDTAPRRLPTTLTDLQTLINSQGGLFRALLMSAISRYCHSDHFNSSRRQFEGCQDSLIS